MNNRTKATYRKITEEMRAHDRKVAPGSESPQWQAYCSDYYEATGESPGSSLREDDEPSVDFSSFWLAVSQRDYTEASRHGDVDPDWIRVVG